MVSGCTSVGWLDRSRPEVLGPGVAFHTETLVVSILYSSGTCTETAANYGTAMCFSTSKNDVKIFATTISFVPSVKQHSRIPLARRTPDNPTIGLFTRPDQTGGPGGGMPYTIRTRWGLRGRTGHSRCPDQWEAPEEALCGRGPDGWRRRLSA